MKKILLLAMLLIPAICEARLVIHDGSGSGRQSGNSSPMSADKSFLSRCQNKWPNDYSMQSYCIEKLETALKSVNAWYYGIYRDDNIYNSCYIKWADGYGPQWDMVEYCIERELNAKRRVYGR